MRICLISQLRNERLDGSTPFRRTLLDIYDMENWIDKNKTQFTFLISNKFMNFIQGKMAERASLYPCVSMSCLDELLYAS